MITNSKIEKRILKPIYLKTLGDRRYRFNDFSGSAPESRQITSPVMQFYSSVDNIGNYMPVIGIQEMIGQTTDTWCIHDKAIDFDFINQNYACVIIGGAGLLHECFELFWSRLLSECKLPMIIWGIGVCLPDASGVRTDLAASVQRSGVSQAVVKKVSEKCDLVNVRDNLTADYYNLGDADISACPTVFYLKKFRSKVNRKSKQVLYSSHKELVDVSDQEKIYQETSSIVSRFKYTDNIQKYNQGLEDIIQGYYCRSGLVVTTRLHGAITAYGLEIPYIAIPRDKKVREFHEIYGNGLCVEDIADLKYAIGDAIRGQVEASSIKIDAVEAFGKRACEWVQSHCSK